MASCPILDASRQKLPRIGHHRHSHEGEEVAYILEGQVEFIVGDERFQLKAGDSICYRSEQPHGYRNGGDDYAKLIVVNTPPSF